MNITLSPASEKRISERISQDDFESVDAFVEQALEYFLEAEGSEPMSDAEFREVQDAIREATSHPTDPASDGVSLEDFDRAMRAKSGIPH